MKKALFVAGALVALPSMGHAQEFAPLPGFYIGAATTGVSVSTLIASRGILAAAGRWCPAAGSWVVVVDGVGAAVVVGIVSGAGR